MIIKNTTTALPFAPTAMGQQVAVLFKVIDAGTQAADFQGRRSFSPKVIMVWEIHGAGVTRYGSLPTVTKFYTASMHPKSNLRKDIEAWLGRALTIDEADSFDLGEWLGRGCLMDVGTTGKYPRVDGLHPLPADKQVAAVNEAVIFDLDAPDMRVFASLSDNIRGMIEASPEWRVFQEKTAAIAPSESYPTEFDELPIASHLARDLARNLASLSVSN